MKKRREVTGRIFAGAAALALAALLAAPAAPDGSPFASSAEAQLGPVDPPVQIEFTAVGGVLHPAGTLVDGSDVPGPDLELSDGVAFGGNVGLRLIGGLGVEGQLLYAPSLDLQTADGDAVTGADFLAGTANLIFRLSFPIIEPYVGGGVGLRRVGLDDPVVLGTDAETDVTGSLLAGVYVSLVPGLTLRGEVRDYISRFTDPRDQNTRFQNDFAFLAGISYRIP